MAFTPGQYLELEVPHRHPDARGTRREFSIASAPEDLPILKVAFREIPGAKTHSSYKKALAQVSAGDALAVTGVWGDFLLPKKPGSPVLMVAAGIGITPFVSQLRHARLAGEDRDIVLVYVAPGGIRARVPRRARGIGGAGRRLHPRPAAGPAAALDVGARRAAGRGRACCRWFPTSRRATPTSPARRG